MYLEQGEEDHSIIGAFYFTADWVPRLMQGKLLPGGRIKLKATAELDPLGSEPPVPAGHIGGVVTASSLVGSWTPPDHGKEVPVRLKAVPPIDCKEAEGPWQEFHDPKWPIIFSYPASWHLAMRHDKSTGADEIALTCPDPSTMMYDESYISITQGTIAGEIPYNTVRCGDTLRFFSCKCPPQGCPDPGSKPHGFTVIDQSTGESINESIAEWRNYRFDVGYVGQGDGVRQVLLYDDKWVELSGQEEPSFLIDRIVTTAKKAKQ